MGLVLSNSKHSNIKLSIMLVPLFTCINCEYAVIIYTALNMNDCGFLNCVHVPYSGRFSFGANFRIFRMTAQHTKVKTIRI